MKKIGLIFNRKQKIFIVIIILLMLVCAGLETATTSLMLPFATALIGTSSSEGAWKTMVVSIFNCDDEMEYIAVMCAIIMIAYIVKCLFAILNSYIQQIFVVSASNEISTRVFNILTHKPYAYYLHHTSAEIQQRVITDVGMMFTYINAMLTGVTELMVALMLLAVLLKTSFALTIVAGAAIVISVLVTNHFVSQRLKENGIKMREHNTEQIKWVSQTVGGLKGILVNKRQKIFVDNFSQAQYLAMRCNGNQVVLSSIPRNIVESTSMIGAFGAMLLVLLLGDDVATMLPAFATFAVAAIRLMPSANRIISSMNTMQFNKKSFDIVYQVLAEEQGEPNKIKEETVGESFKFTSEICVNNISYKFDDTERWLYKNVNLTIPCGKSVAFIGTTGSGKTTMADLILGLLHPNKGEILVDGIDINQHLYEWSNMIGYIPQNIYLCDDSIKANIAYGLREEDIDENKVWDVLKRAQLDEFVMKLDNGLETEVGEAGVRLSGGQRQRIGIARALYFDPEFLVMDEATSALDNETEKAIMDAIDALAGEKTLLIIAHRLTTIAKCDIVYRIENGSVIEETVRP